MPGLGDPARFAQYVTGLPISFSPCPATIFADVTNTDRYTLSTGSGALSLDHRMLRKGPGPLGIVEPIHHGSRPDE